MGKFLIGYLEDSDSEFQVSCLELLHELLDPLNPVGHGDGRVPCLLRTRRGVGFFFWGVAGGGGWEERRKIFQKNIKEITSDAS